MIASIRQGHRLTPRSVSPPGPPSSPTKAQCISRVCGDIVPRRTDPDDLQFSFAILVSKKSNERHRILPGAPQSRRSAAPEEALDEGSRCPSCPQKVRTVPLQPLGDGVQLVAEEVAVAVEGQGG